MRQQGTGVIMVSCAACIMQVQRPARAQCYFDNLWHCELSGRMHDQCLLCTVHTEHGCNA